MQGRQHPESVSAERRFLEHVELTAEESFRMAERIMRRSAERCRISDESIRERFMVYVPLMSERLGNAVSQIASMFQQAPADQIDKLYDSLERLRVEMKKMNDEADGKEQKELDG